LLTCLLVFPCRPIFDTISSPLQIAFQRQKLAEMQQQQHQPGQNQQHLHHQPPLIPTGPTSPTQPSFSPLSSSNSLLRVQHIESPPWLMSAHRDDASSTQNFSQERAVPSSQLSSSSLHPSLSSSSSRSQPLPPASSLSQSTSSLSQSFPSTDQVILSLRQEQQTFQNVISFYFFRATPTSNLVSTPREHSCVCFAQIQKSAGQL
jgi:hypothetical protein